MSDPQASTASYCRQIPLVVPPRMGKTVASFVSIFHKNHGIGLVGKPTRQPPELTIFLLPILSRVLGGILLKFFGGLHTRTPQLRRELSMTSLFARYPMHGVVIFAIISLFPFAYLQPEASLLDKLVTVLLGYMFALLFTLVLVQVEVIKVAVVSNSGNIFPAVLLTLAETQQLNFQPRQV